MGSKYSNQTISGYNASPPSDDGAVTDANKTKWSHVTDKIGGPVKTLAEAINSALITHFDVGPVSISANTTLDDTHYGKSIEASTSITITLTDASTLGAGWYVLIKNVGSVDVTIAPQTTADTIDGSVVTSVSLGADEFMFVQAVNAANGFFTYKGNVNELANLLTTPMDLVYASATSVPSALGVGNDGQALTVGAGATSYGWWVPRDWISGLELSNNSTDANNDIDIAVGEASDSTNGYMLKLTSGLTKQMDNPFAVGNNAGGMFNASKETSTTYHAFLIHKTDDGSVDVGFSTSVSAADIPSGYAVFRRIGSVMSDASGNIVPFFQTGNEFMLDVPVQDYYAVNPGTNAVTATCSIPLGVVYQVLATPVVRKTANALSYGLLTSFEQTNTVPSASSWNFGVFTGDTAGQSVGSSQGRHRIKTNVDAQVRMRVTLGSSGCELHLLTSGWIDERK